MYNAICHLNYVAVIVVTIIGFLFGWLWYSPLLFGKAWRTEMKISDEQMKECAQKGMGKFLIKGFIYTLLGTFGLAVLISGHRSPGALKGAELGLFVGALIVGVRMLNSGVWEQRSCRLQAISIGHEILLFTLQSAIFGVWR
ncbi:MAG: DUF1761 domain-containing protein [Verrucomicrobiota bacterium]|nr:DUF1761 domain-containing protein [Verrucomicrobiota bacterium]